MKENNVIIYGVGRFAEYVRFILEKDGDYKIVGQCVEQEYITKNNVKEKELISFENLEKFYNPSKYKFFIAVGNNKIRKKIFDMVQEKGYSFISHVSDKTHVSEDIKLGENILIADNSIIQPFVIVEDSTIIMGSKIGHHSKIGKHNLLSGAHLGGNVKIGDHSFLGLNVAIKENTTVAKNNIIGMGCNISSDTKPGEVYSAPKPIKRTISYSKIIDRYL